MKSSDGSENNTPARHAKTVQIITEESTKKKQKTVTIEGEVKEIENSESQQSDSESEADLHEPSVQNFES